MCNVNKNNIEIRNRKNSLKLDHLHQRNCFAKIPPNLKFEGDIFYDTETAEQFIEYLQNERPKLSRKSTTLQLLEGNFDLKSEAKDEYVAYQYHPKSPLVKRHTTLCLQGNLNISTENRDQFIPFTQEIRKPLAKRNTNLHLEGDFILQPEYQSAYVEHKQVERSKLKTPINHLRANGIYDSRTDETFNYGLSPVIPFLRDYKQHINGNCRNTSHLNAMQSTAKLKKAKTSLSLRNNAVSSKSEYNQSYANFYKDAYGKFGALKNPHQTDQQREVTPTTTKLNSTTRKGRAAANLPNYKKSIVDSNGKVLSKHKLNTNNQSNCGNSRFFELEGPVECQPEYRKAFIDYITREKIELKSRPIERLSTQPKRVFSVTEKQPEVENKATSSQVSTDPLKGNPVKKNSKSPNSKKLSPENIAQMENCLLGAKVCNPNNKSDKHVLGAKKKVIKEPK